MAHSPSKRWEDGVLVERAKSTPMGDGENDAVAVTGRANDLPIVERDPALPNTTFAERAKARAGASRKKVDGDDAEDKAVSRASTKSKK